MAASIRPRSHRKSGCIEMTALLTTNASLLAAAVFAGGALLISGQASADDDAILASCKADLQFSDSACACVLDKVHETLNERQLAFFVAALRKDTQAQMKAQMDLTGAEMMEMANFMTQTPQQCQNQ
ncbi:MAG: hypothetical protein JJ969_11200 [Rhizobiaceae bacterium]|nr:hypothetical protein [Rhizobiaceae bacterium]